MVGSFLNVVIYRLPLMMNREWRVQCAELLQQDAPPHERFNLAFPASHCPACKHPIGALENIPLLSYLLQRGKCRHCGVHIPLRYPLIEFITGLMSALVIWQFGASWPGLFALLFTWTLIALTVIDFDHQLLPDSLTLPLLWLGLLLSLWGLYVDSHASIVGASVGYLLLWSVYWLFKLVTGREGMGYGDFKLLAALGAWMGWQAIPLVVLLSSLVGASVGISLILFRGRDRQLPIPFGPYLAAAGWIAMMWGNTITESYLRLAMPAQ
ncbi:MAG TPA: A24 family peptidase [Gammaproteobacteria bacterium]